MRALAIGCDGMRARRSRGCVELAGTGALEGDLPGEVSVVVLGPRVCVRADPDSVAHRLDRFGGAVLVVASDAEPSACGAWDAACVGVPVPPSDALDVALRLLRERPLARLSPREWIGGRFETLPVEMQRTLRVPRALHAPTVTRWAGAIGKRPRELRRTIKRMLNTYPREALRDYLLRSARARLAEGWPQRVVAATCGYSGRTVLSRALNS